MSSPQENRYYHEMATIIASELDFEENRLAIVHANMRAAFAGLSRESRDDIQALIVERFLSE